MLDEETAENTNGEEKKREEKKNKTKNKNNNFHKSPGCHSGEVSVDICQRNTQSDQQKNTEKR